MKTMYHGNSSDPLAPFWNRRGPGLNFYNTLNDPTTPCLLLNSSDSGWRFGEI